MIDDDYIRPDNSHSALLVIDVQCDFTLVGAPFEIPGTFNAVNYIKSLVLDYRKKAIR